MDDILLYPKCYICSAKFSYLAECKIRPGVYSYRDGFEIFWDYDAWNHYFRLSKSNSAQFSLLRCLLTHHTIHSPP